MTTANTLAALVNSSSQVVVPSGGINFADIQTAASGATSEIFDSYEEGTWTPTFSGATFSYTDSFGVYVKVGNLVTVHAYINASYSSANASFTLNNLPFTVFNNNARGGQDTVNCQFGVTFTGYVTLEPIGNTTQAFFENNRSGANRLDMNSSNFASAGFAVRFSSTYRSAT